MPNVCWRSSYEFTYRVRHLAGDIGSGVIILH